jgi:hypothetical protein
MIYVNIEYLEERLTANVEAHVSSLRHVLRSLEDGAYHQHRNRTSAHALVQYELHEVADRDVETIVRRELTDCFIGLVRSFYDFMDSVLAARALVSEGSLVLPRDIGSDDDLDALIIEEIDQRRTVIQANRSLFAPAKFESLGPYNAFLTQAGLGYIALRNALEHRSGRAPVSTWLNTLEVVFTLDDRPVTKVPFAAKKGSCLGYRIEERSRPILAGERIDLSEVDIEAVARTLVIAISPAIVANEVARWTRPAVSNDPDAGEMTPET